MRLVLGFSFCLLVLLADPVDIEQSELVQTESLHIVMVYHVKTQVEQRLVLAGLRFEQGTQGELEFVEHGFVDDTRTVDEVLEQRIFTDGLQMLFALCMMTETAATGAILQMLSHGLMTVR